MINKKTLKLAFLSISLILICLMVLFGDGKWKKFLLRNSKTSHIIKVSKESGTYEDSFELTIKVPKHVNLYYTTDGSTPNLNSIPYEKSIYISGEGDVDSVEGVSNHCTVLRIGAFDDAGDCLETRTFSYFVATDDIPGLKNMNILSLVVNPDDLFDKEKGIYTEENAENHGKEWEKPAEAFFYDTEGNLVLDQAIGVRIHGNTSRGDIKKSLNLYAREEYGETPLKYFGEDLLHTGYPADAYTLMAGMSDPTMMKEYLAMRFTEGQVYETYAIEPYVMFLNGEYYGVYWLHEKYDSAYFEFNYGIDEKNLVMIKNLGLEQGVEDDLDEWNTQMYYMDQMDFSDIDNYNNYCDLIDMENAAKFYAAEIYMQNMDSPYNMRNNIIMWKSRKAIDNNYLDGKWRFALFDFNWDETMTDPSYSMIDYFTKDREDEDRRYWFFDKMYANDDFKELVYDEILAWKNEIATYDKAEKYISEADNLLRIPMELDAKKFYDDSEAQIKKYQEGVDGLYNFYKLRGDYVIKDIEEHNN